LTFDGGVLHVIDKALTVPESGSKTLISAGLTGLYGALDDTGLLPYFDTLGNLTIFAPNNAAFAAVASGFAGVTTDVVNSILQYHVVQGKVSYSPALVDGTVLYTLDGTGLTIHVVNGEIFVNNAKVVTADILTGNGVVHIIDE
jgi:uncharacterized surface protein with fasciclin (FAS1) repeats